MFSLSSKAIDVEALKEKLANGRAGALVIFEGLVRNHNEGADVNSLEYEAFAELAISEGEKIIAEAKERFDIYDAACVHREGHLQIKDLAVWVGVTSSHRADAYKANQYIIDEIKTRLPIWKKEHYVSKDAEWVNCQACYNHSHVHYHEHDYYQSQLSLDLLLSGGQDKLKGARALIIGAGGLGCAALSSLVGSGVGHITIIDNDKVDISNLHRQHLYTVDDIGNYKADVAKKRLSSMNPFVEIKALAKSFDLNNAKDLMSNHDLIIDCSDNFKTKFLAHDAAFLFAKPLVQASVYQQEGQIAVYMPSSEAGCLRCNWPIIPADDCVQSCSDAGIMPHTAAIIGSMQAMEAIEIILGHKTDNHNHNSLINFPNLDVVKVERIKDENCPLCSNKAKITELENANYLNLSEFELLIEDESELSNFTLIDVSAQQSEYSASRNIRHMGSSNIEEFLKLDKEKKYLLICQKGIDSLKLTKELRATGYANVYSLWAGFSAFIEGSDVI